MSKVKEILKKVRRLEVETNILVEGLIAGNYRSVFKGRGVEFSEVREYVAGDDIRTIDWNVTARFNTPFVKEFIEERDLDIYIVFDVSASNEFGPEKSKRELGIEVAASIMLAAVRNNDNVGLCMFTDRIEKFVRPRKGEKFVLKLLRDLLYFQPKSKATDINNALTQLARILKKRSVVFILSDFISGDFEKPIRLLRNRHDVILIKLEDVNERTLPTAGYIFMEDLETGEQILVDTSDEAFRRAYIQHLDEIERHLIDKMKRLGVDVIKVSTDQPFHIPLRRFFAMRRKRMTR